MTRSRAIRVYSDYKSPYAFLAKDLAYELEQQTRVKLDWLPYTFGVPSFLLEDGDLYWGREHLPGLRELLKD